MDGSQGRKKEGREEGRGRKADLVGGEGREGGREGGKEGARKGGERKGGERKKRKLVGGGGERERCCLSLWRSPFDDTASGRSYSYIRFALYVFTFST